MERRPLAKHYDAFQLEKLVIAGARSARDAMYEQYGDEEKILDAVMAIVIRLREVIHDLDSATTMYALFITAGLVAQVGLGVDVQPEKERIN